MVDEVEAWTAAVEVEQPVPRAWVDLLSKFRSGPEIEMDWGRDE